MQVLKIRNLSTGEYYFTRVEDSDRKRDPLNKFDALVSNGRGTMSNVDRTVIGRNLSMPRSAAILIKSRLAAKLDPKHIDTTPTAQKAKVTEKPKEAEVKKETSTPTPKEAKKETTQPVKKETSPKEAKKPFQKSKSKKDAHTKND